MPPESVVVDARIGPFLSADAEFIGVGEAEFSKAEGVLRSISVHEEGVFSGFPVVLNPWDNSFRANIPDGEGDEEFTQILLAVRCSFVRNEILSEWILSLLRGVLSGAR